MRPTLERLEDRTVPSAPPFGLTPAQVRHAYGFDAVSFGGVAGDGSGQTIALIEAYSDPALAPDLAVFDATYGLPGPQLTVVNQTGGVPTTPANALWELETSLDVEWAHATAPGANILVVEATTGGWSDLESAIGYASQHASVVSMSFGGAEFAGESSLDPLFNVPGVVFTASSGDSGVSQYPAASPSVLAVGGTDLNVDGVGDYLGETTWPAQGAGASPYEPGRTTPDVSYDAGTDFAVYDSSYGTSWNGWVDVGGTSAGAPQWAALMAVADQGRALHGMAPLSGAMIHAELSLLPSGDFYYVPGEGLGTPRANRLAADLAGYAPPGVAPSLLLPSGAVTYAVYDGHGVYEEIAPGTWVPLPGNTTGITVAAADGKGDLFASVPGWGVQEYSDGVWRQLTAGNASLLAADARGDVIGEFPGYGVYEEPAGAATWGEVSSGNATLLVMDAAGDAYGAFPGSDAVYEAAAGGTFTHWLTGGVPTSLGLDAAGDLFGEFPGYGLWELEVGRTAWEPA